MNESTQNQENLGEEKIDRLEELLSLHFDDCLSDEQITELNEIMVAQPAARTRLLELAQLHSDLHELFNGKQTPIAPALPSVLGVASFNQPIG